MAWWAKQIGPLPAGAWIATVGGGLGLALVARRFDKPEPIEVLPDPAAGGPVGLGSAGGVIGGGTVGGGGVDAGTKPETNDEWFAVAYRALTVRAGADPNLIDSALRKYLAGDPLTARESQVKALALQLVGPPPFAPPPPLPPVPKPPKTPKPTPPPKPPAGGNPKPGPGTTPKPKPPAPAPPPPPPASQPPRLHIVPDAGENTFAWIAGFYYGNAGRWTDVASANRAFTYSATAILPPHARITVPMP